MVKSQYFVWCSFFIEHATLYDRFRYKDLVNYMTGVKVEPNPLGVYGLPQPPKMISSLGKYKKQLITILVKAKMIEQALYLCTCDVTADLSRGFLDAEFSIEKFPGIQKSIFVVIPLHGGVTPSLKPCQYSCWSIELHNSNVGDSITCTF